ncbi:flagellar hook assembly protein FlgD [Polycladidibacter stylochi]|uniref:flagellar hook assembly protein FlgD n=1 Tax=Polycladidibacter stylochi TaxID=1807766 RepID=UPI00082ED449|nr:flagellar hook assembly protein FlgD [Pseudovibrio stylochi]
MTVSPVTPAASTKSNPTTSTQRTDKSYLDYQAFLKLFMASLKNQDPTAPMKTAEYMGQLAQFSNVEQTVQMNKNLTAMMQQSNVNQASNLIGKYVTTSDGVVGKVSSIKIFSDGNVAILDDGTKVLVGPGMTVSETKPEAKA